jgi:DNA polymerase (family 10)
MPVANAEIARLLREVGDLLEIQEANPFRVRAYRNAARTLESHPEPIAELAATPEALEALPGIGEDLAGKIAEIVRTGRLTLLQQLRRETPKGVREMMSVPGVGPRKATRLHEALGIRGLADLARAARAGRLRTIKGFGPKTEERILRELGAVQAAATRTLRATAAQYAEPLLAWLRDTPGVRHADIAGSFRRCLETVGDLDILVTGTDPAAVVARFVSYPEVKDVIAEGPTRAAVRLQSGLQVDLRVLPQPSYGSGLYYFTGSKAHNIAVRRLGQAHKLKINEYGVFRGNRRIGGATERQVLDALGLPWIPPELREDRGEIAAAADGHLPHLVELSDIRGDLQCHTTDSDGRDDLEAMARAAETIGYEYLAVTDHTPAVRVAGGLDRSGFRRQRKRIEALNGTLDHLTILAGAEVDILRDGRLDLDDDTLDALDFVVVSLHSGLRLGEAEQTARLLRALSHPSVDVFGHPSGRLLGRRQPIAVRWEEIYRAAAERGVILEVNAQPERLDLDDVHVRAAISHGVKLSLGTDAHAVNELRFMRWGVEQARRGWAERDDVVNTLPLPRLRKLLHGQR